MARTRTAESRDREDEPTTPQVITLIHDDLDSQFSACICSFCQDDGFTDCSRYRAGFDFSRTLIRQEQMTEGVWQWLINPLKPKLV
jgi:hypothetical protein